MKKAGMETPCLFHSAEQVALILLAGQHHDHTSCQDHQA